MARRSFGTTWWGKEWIRALEGRAVHDPNRLPRGRSYARNGSPGDLSVEAGAVRARVWGSREEPYEVLLQVRQWRPDEWEWVLDAIAAKASHAAALLEGDLDPGIVDDARSAEVEVLPRSGELRTACTCPDLAEPCKHAAAVCYLMAHVIDDDPFVLFHLRGLDRRGVLDAIRSRRAAATPTGRPSLGEAGVEAREAWARPVPDEPLPAPPAPPPRPGHLAPFANDPSAGAPFDAEGLRLLAADAARRAWAMRTGASGSAHLFLDPQADLARWAAEAGPAVRRRMVDTAGRRPAELEMLAEAWEVAGPDGVAAVVESSYDASDEDMEPAHRAVAAVSAPRTRVRRRGNRLIVGDVQYLRTRAGLWFRFAKVGGRWALVEGPADVVEDLLDVPGVEPTE